MTDQERQLAEQFHFQISESLKNVFDLSSRIDERLKLLTQKVDQQDKETENLKKLYTRIGIIETKIKTVDESSAKIACLEMKVHDLELTSGKSENRWSNVFNFVWKLAQAIVAAYILYRLGLK